MTVSTFVQRCGRRRRRPSCQRPPPGGPARSGDALAERRARRGTTSCLVLPASVTTCPVRWLGRFAQTAPEIGRREPQPARRRRRAVRRSSRRRRAARGRRCRRRHAASRLAARPADADDRTDGARALQRRRARAADESDADDGELFDAQGKGQPPWRAALNRAAPSRARPGTARSLPQPDRNAQPLGQAVIGDRAHDHALREQRTIDLVGVADLRPARNCRATAAYVTPNAAKPAASCANPARVERAAAST